MTLVLQLALGSQCENEKPAGGRGPRARGSAATLALRLGIWPGGGGLGLRPGRADGVGLKVREAEVDCGVAAGPHGPVVNDGLGHLYGGLSLWT
jgi:hypothetical protein